MMKTGTYRLSAPEQAQFREAFHDNMDLVLDILEAMRCESTFAADPTAALFLGGIQQALNAFGNLRSLPPGPSVQSWSAVQSHQLG